MSYDNNHIISGDNIDIGDIIYTHSANQHVSYNTQGDLTIDDKCLSYDENKKYFKKLSRSRKHKEWLLDDTYIKPSNDITQSLATIDHNSVSDISQQVTNTTLSSGEKLQLNKGKGVVLMDSDNPWYFNSNTVIPDIIPLPPTVSAPVPAPAPTPLQIQPQVQSESESEMYLCSTKVQVTGVLLLILLIFLIYKFMKHHD